jgi:hypothetical protein
VSGAEVALGAAAPAGTGSTPFVTLANSGLGIEADEIARLFEPFVLRGSGWGS